APRGGLWGGPPQPADGGDVPSPPARLDEIRPLPRHGDGAVHDTRLHQRLADAQRLVAEREDGGIPHIHPLSVALESEHVVAIHAQGDVVTDGGTGRADVKRRAHLLRRERTTSAMWRMCWGPEPQQAPTILQPA